MVIIPADNGSHAFEINLGYEIKGFSIAGNYIVNEAGGSRGHRWRFVF